MGGSSHRITQRDLRQFKLSLEERERSAGTVAKYLRDVRAFFRFGGTPVVSRALLCRWKASLCRRGYAPTTVNSMVAAVNSFLDFKGWQECRVGTVRVQRRLFRDDRRELSLEEYRAVRDAADERTALAMEALCSTGARVSELRFITVEAARAGRAVVSLKGKVRVVMLPKRLCGKLLSWAAAHGVEAGPVVTTRGARPLSRGAVWAGMKAACKRAGVAASKVFPHNLRHLFARRFYDECHDVVRLADVLGHSSVETTRRYIASAGLEHQRQLDRLGLVE